MPPIRTNEKIGEYLTQSPSLYCFFEERLNFAEKDLVGALFTTQPNQVGETLVKLAAKYRNNNANVFNEKGLFQFRVLLQNKMDNELIDLLTELRNCEFFFEFHFVEKNDKELHKKGHFDHRLSSFVSTLREISVMTQTNNVHSLCFDKAYMAGKARKKYYFAIRPDGGAWIPAVTQFADRIIAAKQTNTAVAFETLVQDQDWSVNGACLQATDLILGAVGMYLKTKDDKFYKVIQAKLFSDGITISGPGGSTRL